MSFISVEVLVWDFSFENSPCASDWGVRIYGRDWESVKTSFPRQAVLKKWYFFLCQKKKKISHQTYLFQRHNFYPLYAIFFSGPNPAHYTGVLLLSGEFTPWALSMGGSQEGCSGSTDGPGGVLVGMHPAPAAGAMHPIMCCAVVLSHCGHCEGSWTGTRKCAQNFLFAACFATENNWGRLLMPLIVKCFP